jgi:GDPmannose 4,6-dehydratase
MKAIIFGANGQDGHYLCRLLEQNDVEVVRVSRTGSETLGDVSNYSFVEGLVKKHLPDHIFHLAANSSTSHDLLFENHQTISTGTLNILEAVRKHSPSTCVFLSGSAMQFVNDGQPINEQTPFDPSSPYAVARIHSVYAARYFRKAFSLKIYVGYFFHHDSPLRSEHHVNQKIVKTIRRIAEGSNEKLKLGNMDVEKEFNFAGDMMEAVWKLVNQEKYFEVVIGSGEAHSIKEWVEYCFGKAGLKMSDHIELETGYVPLFRKLVSDPTLIHSIGWRPKVDFQSLANMMMDA